MSKHATKNLVGLRGKNPFYLFLYLCAGLIAAGTVVTFLAHGNFLYGGMLFLVYIILTALIVGRHLTARKAAYPVMKNGNLRLP